jgi:hypothetical protein
MFRKNKTKQIGAEKTLKQRNKKKTERIKIMGSTLTIRLI